MLSVLHRGVSTDGIESARSSAGSKGRDRRGSYRPHSAERVDKADHQRNDGSGARAGLGAAHDQGTGDDVHAYYLGADDNHGNHNDLGAVHNHSNHNDLGADHHNDLGTDNHNDLGANNYNDPGAAK